jgi:hypothetical protein
VTWNAGTGVDRLLVAYPGNKPYTLATGADVIPAERVAVFVV